MRKEQEKEMQWDELASLPVVVFQNEGKQRRWRAPQL